MDKLLDLTRDFDAAKAAFEAYLDEYDRTDDKIHLKIVHTYGVVDAAEDIARRMGLDEEDVQLAKVIGLLHDIGRFEQIRRFDSFEPGTMEHAVYGAQLLFGSEKMIRRHPHVFGTTAVSGSKEVLVNWAEIKKQEKELTVL